MSNDASISKAKATIVYPPYTRVVTRPKPASYTDEIAVRLSSLFIVGSVVWGPFLTYKLVTKVWNKYGVDTKSKRNLILFGTIVSVLLIIGPHRHHRVGKALNARGWNIWKSWLKFVAFEVIQDIGNENDDSISSSPLDLLCQQAILSIVPHGIFPFSLGLAALPEDAIQAFGVFRPVVATATSFFPILRTLISWMGAVNASKSSVNTALTQGHSIGLAPGGIAGK